MRAPLSGFVCLLGLVLTACSPTVDTGGPVQGAHTSNITLVQITNDSVGGITADTAYGQKSIAAALPGFTTEGVQTAVENNTEWAIAAFNSDGFQVLQAFKGKNGKIRTVHGVTHHLAGPNGERIGMTFHDIGLASSDCRIAQNLWRGMAICQARNAPNVKLVFAIPQYDGPWDRLPPDIQLQDSELQRILWTPKS